MRGRAREIAAGGLRSPRQREREQQVGELRLPVSEPALVVAIALEVLEADTAIADVHLEAVARRSPRERHDAGVVDEDVERLVFGGLPRGEGVDRGEVGEVELCLL